MTSSIEVIVSPQADADVQQILMYTFRMWGTGQRDAYERVLERGFRRISEFPDIGHPVEGRPSNIREHHLRHHVVVYRHEPERVVILRVVNPRRRARS